MALATTDAKQHAHELIDRMAPGQDVNGIDGVNRQTQKVEEGVGQWTC